MWTKRISTKIWIWVTPGRLSVNLYGEKAFHRRSRHASTGTEPMTLARGKLLSGMKASVTVSIRFNFCNGLELGAPWHRSQLIQTHAQQLGIEILQLPGYSPDLNPIEGLWKWMREEVTQHFCHDSLHDLFVNCKALIERINLDPDAMISRLWPKFDLDPDYEKLLFPT